MEKEIHSKGQMITRFVWWKMRKEFGRWCTYKNNPSKAVWIKEY